MRGRRLAKAARPIDEIDNIEGIGETVVDALIDFFCEQHNVEAVDELLEHVDVLPFERVQTKASPSPARRSCSPAR